MACTRYCADVCPEVKNGGRSIIADSWTAQSRQISEYTFKTFEAFTAATLIYVVITLTVIFLMRWLEKSVAGTMRATVLKLTQVGEESILRRSRELRLRN